MENTLGYFETERLILRRWEEKDAEPFARMNADPDVMRYFPSVLTRNESDALIQKIEIAFEKYGYGLWAIEHKADGNFIGFTGLTIPYFEAFFMPSVEIGWRFSKKYWGFGFASESAIAALKIGFDLFHLTEIVSFTSELNIPSEKVMKRIGMTFSGKFGHPKVPRENKLHPHILYKISPDEFKRFCLEKSK